MKHLRIGLTSLFLLVSLCTFASPLTDLVARILPEHKDQIVFHIQAKDVASDYFTLRTEGGKLAITANSPVSAANALNWYLKYHCNCSISFCEDQLNLPKVLPALTAEVHKETALTTNFYMNYCTFSYSTAFWDWNRWEREIDW